MGIKRMKISPLKIEILLFYYCRPTEDFPNYDSPAQRQAINEFIELGLLYGHDAETVDRLYPNIELEEADALPLYGANREALKLYVDALCRVELPTRKWVV